MRICYRGAYLQSRISCLEGCLGGISGGIITIILCSWLCRVQVIVVFLGITDAIGRYMVKAVFDAFCSGSDADHIIGNISTCIGTGTINTIIDGCATEYLVKGDGVMIDQVI